MGDKLKLHPMGGVVKIGKRGKIGRLSKEGGGGGIGSTDKIRIISKLGKQGKEGGIRIHSNDNENQYQQATTT